MSFINDNIKAARKKSGKSQDDIAKELNVPRSTYANWEARADPEFDIISKIAKILGYTFAELVDEQFVINNELQEPAPKIKKWKKPVKIVDADALAVMDALQIKAMLRVMLRTQAEIISKQNKQPIEQVLKKITDAVRDETSEEFDELK